MVQTLGSDDENIRGKKKAAPKIKLNWQSLKTLCTEKGLILVNSSRIKNDSLTQKLNGAVQKAV